MKVYSFFIIFFYDISFTNPGIIKIINEDTLTHITLNQDIISKKDSILMVMTDRYYEFNDYLETFDDYKKYLLKK